MKRARNAAAPPARRSVVRRKPVLPPPPARREVKDQVLLLAGDWDHYLKLDALCSGNGVRVTYLNGLIEIMSTSPLHELIKVNIRRLLEDYCMQRGLLIGTRGAPTHKKKQERAGEPDESFIFTRGRELPQLVIEVALTSGGLNKLAFWGGFPIEEVWIWKRRRLLMFRWENGAYTDIPESVLVPGFKPEWAERFAEYEVISDLISEFRALL